MPNRANNAPSKEGALLLLVTCLTRWSLGALCALFEMADEVVRDLP